MRIGLYIPGIDKHFVGGPTKYQVNLARALTELNEVELFLLHHCDVYPLNLRAKHIIIKGKTPIIWETRLRKHHLDIIHFNDIPAMRRTFFFILNYRKVVTVHGDLHWIKELFAGYNKPKYRIRRLMQLLSSKFVDAIISVSNDLKNRLVQHLLLSESKIKVIHEGVSPAYRPLKNADRIKQKYNISRPFILHVSNLAPKKNPQTLFKAFNELIRQSFNIDLVIVGARWTNKHVRNMIKEFDLTPRVKILGYVPEKDLIRLYNTAELFVFPSLHESFGFPIVEAMACGTPVITSNAYAIPEIAGDAAMLCDPLKYNDFAEAMRRVLDDPELRKKMRAKGLKNAKKFSWKKCALETVKLYEQLLATK